MFELIAGLVLFLGVHSVRIFANDWRSAQLAPRGEAVWKLGYSALSIAGFVMIVWGYGLVRQSPMVLWPTPRGMNHLAALLTLISFVLLVATYVPRNAIKAKLRHPMILGVKVWALAHLLANNTLADLLLFGSFLIWAMLSFRAARQRDRHQPLVQLASNGLATAATVVVGVVAWAAFAFWGHLALIGVRPLG